MFYILHNIIIGLFALVITGEICVGRKAQKQNNKIG